MISPDGLSGDQKRFLKEHYQLDVDMPRPYRRGDRTIYLLRPWFGVFLAFGLLLEKPSDATSFPSQPAEIIAWALVGCTLLFCVAQLLRTCADIRRSPEASEHSRARWTMLFREMIRRRSAYLRWDFPAS